MNMQVGPWGNRTRFYDSRGRRLPRNCGGIAVALESSESAFTSTRVGSAQLRDLPDAHVRCSGTVYRVCAFGEAAVGCSIALHASHRWSRSYGMGCGSSICRANEPLDSTALRPGRKCRRNRTLLCGFAAPCSMSLHQSYSEIPASFARSKGQNGGRMLTCGTAVPVCP